MITVYTHGALPSVQNKAIFLAGPTPRSRETRSWRPEALRILRDELGYTGHVFVPEAEDGVWKNDYTGQVEWEDAGLNQADIIVFWIPRDMSLDSENKPRMAAQTTNDEFGFWKGKDPGRLIVGIPPTADNANYQRHYAAKLLIPLYTDLKATLQAAVERLGDGVERQGGECQVPLHIWNARSFQGWLWAQKKVGNRLDASRIEWAFRTKDGKNTFCWAMKVNVFVASENRNKTNEFVLSRTDTSSICAWHRGIPIKCVCDWGRVYDQEYSHSTCKLCNGLGEIFTRENIQIVLVREFRSPSTSDDAFVWELPGGSSFKPNQDPLSIAAEELHEELGLIVDPKRLKQHVARQAAATFSAHKVHLFSLELSDNEWDKMRYQEHVGEIHGVAEDSEVTYTRVRKLSDIRKERLVDWTTLGMIDQALTEKS